MRPPFRLPAASRNARNVDATPTSALPILLVPALAIPLVPALVPTLVTALMISLASPPVQAQSLAVKPGVWETTAKSPLLPKPQVTQDCVTQADLGELAAGPDKDEDESCKLVKPATVSGNKWVADRRCADGRRTHAEFVAESAEKVSGVITSTEPKGGESFRIELSSRWLKAGCAGGK